MNFEQWQNKCAPAALRLFSLGRHALVEALRAAGIKAGDAVLLPEFICRDVLASLHAVGADAVWYPVSSDLLPASSPATWPQARALLAVNYFGFPQDFEPFRAYAARTGAVLIEDNAHGFLSRDQTGRWLGTRGCAGLFSIRKSLPVPDGAALLVMDQGMAQSLAAPLKPEGAGYLPQTAWKAGLRGLPMFGVAAANAMTSAVRLSRRLRSGHGIAPPDENAEREIPHPPQPYSALMANLETLDVDREVERRRALYHGAEDVARSLGIAPLFAALPSLVAPYGFPFRTELHGAVDEMRRWARKHGLELIRWPDLPRALERDLPAYHRGLWLVNFL